MICSFASVLVCMFKMNYFSKFTRFIIYVFALVERIRSSYLVCMQEKMAVMQSILFSSAVSMYNTISIALWIYYILNIILSKPYILNYFLQENIQSFFLYFPDIFAIFYNYYEK